MNKGTNLKAVESMNQKPKTGVDLWDNIYQIRQRQGFLTEAIYRVWGNGDSCYCENKNMIEGCHLLMQDITDTLDRVLVNLDPTYKTD